VTREKVRACCISLARCLATELAYLNQRGWILEGGAGGEDFRFSKDFYYPAGEEFHVVVAEERRKDGGEARIKVDNRTFAVTELGEVSALVEEDGVEEIKRILVLLAEVLN